jgi:hypothetical protein
MLSGARSAIFCAAVAVTWAFAGYQSRAACAGRESSERRSAAARLSCYASRVRGEAKALAFGAVVASLVLASGRDARASDGRTSSLSWLRMPGADSCIATQALARSVEDRLGRHVFVSASEADVSVEGRIERHAGSAPGWHSVITIRDGKGALLGTRELDRPDGSCAAMNEPLALVIAVMIDPDAALSPPAPPPPAPAPPPTAPPPPVPAPPPAPAPPPPAPAKSPMRFQGDATATISSGLTPSLAAGATVAGALFLPNDIPLGFRAYGSLFVPTSAEQFGAKAHFDLFYVGGAVCPTLRRPAITAMVCIGGQLGVLRSTADTTNRGIGEEIHGLWNGVTEARFTIPLFAPLAITGGAGIVLPLLRPSFSVAREGASGASADLHKVSFLAMTADLGLGFFFP